MESFDGSKPTGFENRIRSGLKNVWLQSDQARSHLMYRVVCKILLTVAAADELQAATPMDVVYKYMLKDPTEVFVKEEAHNSKKKRDKKWRLIRALSFSEDSKKSAFSGIGIGRDDVRLESVLSRLMAMHHADGGGHVTTDDVSNWDSSTTCDGFMLGGMTLFQAMMGAASHQPLLMCCTSWLLVFYVLTRLTWRSSVTN